MVHINEFPDEILEQILFNVPPYQDIEHCALVCRRWESVVNSVRHLCAKNLLKGLNDTRRLFWRTLENPTTTPHHTTTLPPNPASSSFALQHQHQRRSSPSTSAASNPLQPSHGTSASPSSSSSASRSPEIAGRFSHAAIVHGNAMYVFGGGSSSPTTFNDLWRFDLSTRQWHRTFATGTYPTPKACASIAAHGDRLIVFGGWRHPSPNQPHHTWRLFNELHVFDIAARKWSLIAAPAARPPGPRPAETSARTAPATGTADGPPPTTGHSVTVHGTQMIVFGGFQQRPSARAANATPWLPYQEEPYEEIDPLSSSSNALWSLDLETWRWRQVRTAGAVRPAPRYGQHQFRLDERRLLMLGGCGGPNKMFTDAWVLDMREPEAWQWQPVRLENRQWQATYTWCNPSCQFGSKLIFLGPTAAAPSDLQIMNPSAAVRQRNVQEMLDLHPNQNRENPQELRRRQEMQQYQDDRELPPGNQVRGIQLPAEQEREARNVVNVAPAVVDVGVPPMRSPQQIVDEANRRLQLQAASGPNGSGSSNSSSSSRAYGPGPSSGVLVRRHPPAPGSAASSDHTRPSNGHQDDEEAVNRRLKRNLLLKSRDESAEQFLPKRFDQAATSESGALLGLSAFSANASTSSASNSHHHNQSANTPTAPATHPPHHHDERRRQSLLRMEEKIRSIQKDAAVASSSSSPSTPAQPAANARDENGAASRSSSSSPSGEGNRQGGGGGAGPVRRRYDSDAMENDGDNALVAAAAVAAAAAAALDDAEAVIQNLNRTAAAANREPAAPPNPVPVPAPAAVLADTGPVQKRPKRDCVGVFVADISTLMLAPGSGSDAALPVLKWQQCHNGGLITGAPERLILASLVAGNGELIMFGGLHKESLANTMIKTHVSNGLHSLSFQYDIL